MYESPIHLYVTDIQTQIIKRQEDQILKAVQGVGVGVDHDELFRALKYDRDQYDKGFRDGTPKWIPVTERLPDKDGDYLIFKNSPYGGWCEVAGFAKDGGKVDEYDLGGCENVWYDYDSEYGYIGFDSVTHWMPLPEPPEGR